VTWQMQGDMDHALLRFILPNKGVNDMAEIDK
jgi:hypothetical protein